MSKSSLLRLFAFLAILFSAASCNNSDSNSLGTKNAATITKTSPQPQVQLSTPQVTLSPVAFQADTTSAKSAKYTHEAKFLAGMKVKGALASREENQVWQNHAAFFNNVWSKLEKQQLSNIGKWANQELKLVDQSSQVLFYPFSGPDFLYGYSFFPKQKNYVLVGLEPVGSLPNLEKASAAEVSQNLQGIEQSLRAILQWSFFRTNDMKADLSQQGVLPILFVFLARTNNKITDVQYIGLKKDSTISVLSAKNQGKTIPGVRIDFIPVGESEPRSLYYFSTDLSNSGLAKTPEFTKFVQNLGRPVTYLKAASYLLHYDSFSTMRNFILSQSAAVLQDDSGIPVKYFNNSQWNLKFYGSYTQPIALFKDEYQANLKNIYKSKSNVKPLTFGVGYRYQVQDSNLMLATGK